MPNCKTAVPYRGTPEQEERLRKVIEEHKGQPGATMPVLQAAQVAAVAYLADPASPDGPEFAPLMDRVRRLFDNSAELFL